MQQPLHIPLFHWSDLQEKDPGCFLPAGQDSAEWGTQSHIAHHTLEEPKQETFRIKKNFQIHQIRVTKVDWNTVPGVWISALCKAGISLIRLSCISGGMVMDRPWGYKSSDVSPSGSSHTWCCRPGKRSTLDSMEGQYLQKTRGCMVCNVKLLCVCVCLYLGPLVSCCMWQLRWRLSFTTFSTPGVV